MKKVYIVRHAKSNWSNASDIKDIDRSLNTRGVQNAYLMSSRLKEKAVLPDVILSSNGIRALHTAVIFAHQIGFDSTKMTVLSDLYHASPDVIMNTLRKLPETVKQVMLFAHNPGIAEFASFVDKQKYIKVSTCTVLEFEANINTWSEISFDFLTTKSIDFPKK